jgi:hypothetical protein
MRELRFNGEHVIVTENGSCTYLDSKENFEADFGVTLLPLPNGMAGFHYRQDERILVYYDAKQNAFPVEGEADVVEYNVVAEKATQARAKKQFREVKAPKRTPDVFN